MGINIIVTSAMIAVDVAVVFDGQHCRPSIWPDSRQGIRMKERVTIIIYFRHCVIFVVMSVAFIFTVTHDAASKYQPTYLN